MSLVALVAAGCAAFPPAGSHEADRQLVIRVAEFLRADDHEAEQRLPSLADRQPAELESALRTVLSGPPLWGEASPKTGLLPDRPIEVEGVTRRYGLYVPPAYQPTRSYPLIICLHGAGFDGDTYLE
ncbi:MAG TPA: hypothetical protein VEI24_06270, partial [Nitrospiria bacterium]|nr:hypothetical protein [Nitrospiria bacterium]